MWILPKGRTRGSARRQIGIRSVEDGILQLAGGQYRLILEASSINFELRSDDEQDAILDTYRQFLQALPFPLQILIRVRELSMDAYLASLEAKASRETNPIFAEQAAQYRHFIRRFMSTNKVLARHFYLVIPYRGNDKDEAVVYEQLRLNADIVRKSIARLGIRVRRLESHEVLDLFYSFYADDLHKVQPVSERTLELLAGVTL